MTTYYVRTNGNDTNGDGSTGTPWLTITKALNTVSAGDAILVGAGTYAENGTGGRFLYTKTFASYVTIAPESGVLGDVIIQGASATDYEYYIIGKYIKFINLEFTPRVSDTRCLVLMRGSASGVDHVDFIGCKFTIKSIDGTVVKGIEIQPSGGEVIQNITFDNCQIVQTGAYPTTGIYATTGAAAMANIVINNCAINLVGGVSYGIIYGVDANTGNAITGSITNNNILITSAGHAVICGGGSDDVLVTNNVINGAEYGLIIKGGKAIAKYNNVTGGTNSAIYLKASNGATVENNIFRNAFARVFLAGEDGANQCQNNTVRYNTFISSGAGSIMEITSAGNGDGNIYDFNKFKPGGAGYGKVLSDSAVANLAELRAAWSAYGDGTNDSHSRKKSDDSSSIMKVIRFG